MSFFADALSWILAGFADGELWLRLGEHLRLTALSVLVAAAIAVPLGYLIGHTGRGRDVAVAVSGAARALPSFGLVLLLVMLLGVLRVELANYIAFVILAVPSILAGAYAGIQAVDRATVDAARALGMTEWQILWKVEAPLGLSILIGGLRSGTLQVVATATIAAYVGVGGLGFDLLQGLNLNRIEQVLGAALLVTALAFVLDAFFGLAAFVVERAFPVAAPRRRRRLRASPIGRRAAAGSPAN